jgi:hypothetical protein
VPERLRRRLIGRRVAGHGIARRPSMTARLQGRG